METGRVVPGLLRERVLFDHVPPLGRGPQDEGGRHGQSPVQLRFEGRLELAPGDRGRPEDEIAALQPRDHVLEAEVPRQLSEGRHRDPIAAPDVDPRNNAM